MLLSKCYSLKMPGMELACQKVIMFCTRIVVIHWNVEIVNEVDLHANAIENTLEKRQNGPEFPCLEIKG